MKVDQAAVLGAALAATLAVFLADGRWNLLNSLVGMVLVLILLGYYDFPDSSQPRAWPEFAALASVAGLAIALAAAWPLQQLLVHYEALVAGRLIDNQPYATCGTRITHEAAQALELERQGCLAGFIAETVMPLVMLVSSLAVYICTAVLKKPAGGTAAMRAARRKAGQLP